MSVTTLLKNKKTSEGELWEGMVMLEIFTDRAK